MHASMLIYLRNIDFNLDQAIFQIEEEEGQYISN